MSKDGNSFTHYLVVDERILGETFIVEKISDFISLALVKLALSDPKRPPASHLSRIRRSFLKS